MRKYNKVSSEDVLIMYYQLGQKYWDFLYYIPKECIRKELKTSMYQINKAYKELKELGYMKKIEIPTYTEEYDNGLYTESNMILSVKVYDITDKGIQKAKELIENGK